MKVIPIFILSNTIMLILSTIIVLLADGTENKILSKKIENMVTEDESDASVLYISRFE